MQVVLPCGKYAVVVCILHSSCGGLDLALVCQKHLVPWMVTKSTWQCTTCWVMCQVWFTSLVVHACRKLTWRSCCTFQTDAMMVIIHCMLQLVFDHVVHLSLQPSVLWHCWLGVRKSIQPIKNPSNYWSGAGMLSLWSKVQITCIWSSWCYCHIIIFALVKSRMVYPSGTILLELS